MTDVIELRMPVDVHAVEQPEPWLVKVDGIAINQIYLAKTGMIAAKHVHDYSHHTMLAHGSIRVWIDGQQCEDIKAPRPIFVEAGRQHSFQALEDETVLYCIHNLHGADEIDIVAEVRVKGV